MGRIPSIYQLSLQFDLSGTPVKFPPACVSHGCDANTQTNKHTDRHLNTSQRIQNCVCCSSHYNRWLPSFQKTVTGLEKKHFALISTALTLQTTQVCKKNDHITSLGFFVGHALRKQERFLRLLQVLSIEWSCDSLVQHRFFRWNSHDIHTLAKEMFKEVAVCCNMLKGSFNH